MFKLLLTYFWSIHILDVSYFQNDYFLHYFFYFEMNSKENINKLYVCYRERQFLHLNTFVKEFLHTFGNPATFIATPQHLINASATASVSTPNTWIKQTVNIQIDINSYTFDNKLQYWIELNRVKLFYKNTMKSKIEERKTLRVDAKK